MAQKKGLTREQAAQIYDQLKQTMESRYGKEGLAALMEKERAMKALPKSNPPSERQSQNMQNFSSSTNFSSKNVGLRAAFAMVILAAGLKVGLSALEATGFAEVSVANASMSQPLRVGSADRFSGAELRVLKSLDARRVELEEREGQLDKQQQEISQKDSEFAARLTELRELSDKLKIERERSDRKQLAQYDQLANVYGSMNPEEAAHLIEQLDVTIALSLLQRMPEKRIGQILALMSPERALSITRMLSEAK